MKKNILVLGILLIFIASSAIADNDAKGNKEGKSLSDSKPVEKLQERLLDASDRIVAYVGRLEDRVNRSVTLGEEQKGAILLDLETKVAYFEDVKGDIASATTVQELRDISKEIQARFKDLRADLRVIVGNIWTAHVDGIITKLEGVSTDLSERIDRLNGTNTSALHELLDRFNSYLAGAQNRSDAAKDKLGDITGWEDGQELFHEARDLVRDAVAGLSDSRHAIRGILRNVHETNETDFEDDNETDDDLEDNGTNDTEEQDLEEDETDDETNETTDLEEDETDDETNETDFEEDETDDETNETDFEEDETDDETNETIEYGLEEDESDELEAD